MTNRVKELELQGKELNGSHFFQRKDPNTCSNKGPTITQFAFSFYLQENAISPISWFDNDPSLRIMIFLLQPNFPGVWILGVAWDRQQCLLPLP